MDRVWRYESYLYATRSTAWLHENAMLLCEWDSRARKEHWEKKLWQPRLSLTPGSKNIVSETLVDPSKVLLLHCT